MKRVNFFRKKYPRFIYRRYSYGVVANNLKMVFDFQIEPDIRFRPEITIKNVTRTLLTRNVLDNLVFHLGLIEIPSYWKATIAPEIVIEAGHLNEDQIKWWKDLIIKGMGQFFYENKIDWRNPNFLQIKSTKKCNNVPMVVLLRHRYLVPLGGGKDSIVTLEKLKEQKKKTVCFMVNPTKAALVVHRTFHGLKKPIIVERKIDPKLLELNKRGYLNGHTPFTAVLSFLSILCAVLFDYKNIAFSNEKSANEGNTNYLGRTINHQWAKSSEFEKRFKNYCKKYLAKNINYFSFLRKYTELEIAKMFTKYPKYFPVFSSCNIAGKVGDRWCGKCPKCLFVYLTLYPYLEKKQLLKIFGKDLFDPSTSSRQEKKKLLSIMKSLIGQGSHKPFECVGTYKESRKTFKLSLKKAKRTGKVPYILKRVRLRSLWSE